MAWRFHGRASPNPSSPTAQGQCDRCSFYYQLSSLKFQHEWRGQGLQNTWFRVCPECMDIPAVFKKSIVLPADPMPVPYPRVPPVQQQMSEGQTYTNWDVLNQAWDSNQSWDSPEIS